MRLNQMNETQAMNILRSLQKTERCKREAQSKIFELEVQIADRDMLIEKNLEEQLDLAKKDYIAANEKCDQLMEQLRKVTA